MLVSGVTAIVAGVVRFRTPQSAPTLLLDITFLASCACFIASGLWVLSRRMASFADEETDRAQSHDRG